MAEDIFFTPTVVPSGDRVRPTAGSPRGRFVARVKENRRICTDHFRLILMVRGFPASTPGQFVQLDCLEAVTLDAEQPRAWEWVAGGQERPRPGDADFAEARVYLRRPFSIADQRMEEGASEIDIIHRVVGEGTRSLAHLSAGHEVSLLGPLGVGFRIADDLGLACLVGGGVGIPPMLYLAKALAEKGKKAVGFVGAMRGDLLPVTLAAGLAPHGGGEPLMCVEELACCGHEAVVTTDDGSLGMKGYVTAALRIFLEKRRAERGTLAGVVVYCCGPTPMMKATARVAEEFGVMCQVSLEQPMACGMGTCQSCIIKYRPHEVGAETAWKYKLTCTDGPVFDSRDIVW